MTRYSKLNFVYRLQKWMDSVPGQTFLNYAYSWGASIVILGTLFKLTHLPGANLMLLCTTCTDLMRGRSTTFFSVLAQPVLARPPERQQRLPPEGQANQMMEWELRLGGQSH